jgi:hypothetical protein
MEKEREQPCWGCGSPVPPLSQRPFQDCTLCAKKKFPGLSGEQLPTEVTRFCSTRCHDEIWTVHFCLMHDGKPRVAVKLAEQAIATDAARASAHYALAQAHTTAGDHMRASESFAAAADCWREGSKAWAQAVSRAYGAWQRAKCPDRDSRDSRESQQRSAGPPPCFSKDPFCGCDTCKRLQLPDTPEWMASPQALAAAAEQVVTAWPYHVNSWEMHACAHWNVDWSTASRSFVKLAKLYGKLGDGEKQVDNLGDAGYCKEKANSQSEAERMAPIIAAREDKEKEVAKTAPKPLTRALTNQRLAAAEAAEKLEAAGAADDAQRAAKYLDEARGGGGRGSGKGKAPARGGKGGKARAW